jgi:hypothetical protein
VAVLFSVPAMAFADPWAPPGGGGPGPATWIAWSLAALAAAGLTAYAGGAGALRAFLATGLAAAFLWTLVGRLGGPGLREAYTALSFVTLFASANVSGISMAVKGLRARALRERGAKAEERGRDRSAVPVERPRFPGARALPIALLVSTALFDATPALYALLPRGARGAVAFAWAAAALVAGTVSTALLELGLGRDSSPASRDP